MNWWDWMVLVLYFGALCFIFLFSLVQLNLLLLYRKAHSKSDDQARPPSPDNWPTVTVQLPVYNEKYVMERLLRAVARLDYPLDKLEIQVLDDSTDETTDIIAGFVANDTSGISISHIRRPERSGFKAGALAYGMTQTSSDFVAIFDADFVPDPSFLKESIPLFANERVGVVQTRWGHLNRGYCPLTRLQAFGLDGHFTVEQSGRNEGGHFINFNGTAGVWRTKTIHEAGGWSSDTLTEDLDLSYRAQLLGWQFVYREDVESPAELPVELNALRSQQYRWNKGAAECARKNLWKVWKTPQVSLKSKIHASFHLLNSSIFISVLLGAVLSVPVMSIKQAFFVQSHIFTGASLFLLSLVILYFFYREASLRAQPNLSWSQFIGLFFNFLSLSMGLSLHNAIAVFEGFIGRKTPFVRTPKFNVYSAEDDWISNQYRQSKVATITFLELAFGLYFLSAIWYGIQLGDYGLVPFHILLTYGFFSLVGLSVKQQWMQKKKSPLFGKQ